MEKKTSTYGSIADNILKRSSDLCTLLELAGASEDVRRILFEAAIRFNIFNTVVMNPPFSEIGISSYIMGSSFEGTCVPGRPSDQDVIHCCEVVPVVETLKDAPQSGRSLLLVTNDDTRPGYVQLQVVIDGKPQDINERPFDPDRAEIDDLGRLFTEPLFVVTMDGKYTCNGPAVTQTYGPYEMDTVLAYRCRTIPKAYESWFHSRDRRWPSKAQIRKLESLGCLFVGVGHPKSRNQSIEWRVSFSLQEKELMSSLNPIQHKCYILLKMIKEDIIRPKVGGKHISSYHCKTCLFHTIVKFPQFEWCPGNLVKGTRLCFETMLNCAMDGNCPNFFIPASNLFDKMDQNILRNVTDVIQNLLSETEWVKVLSDIEHNLHGFQNNFRASSQRILLHNIALDVLTARKVVLEVICLGNSQKAKDILKHLKVTDVVTEHDPKDVRKTLDSLVPHVHLQIAQRIASSNLDMIDDSDPTFMYHLKEGEKCDAISSQLVLASFYLREEKLQACEVVLKACCIAIARPTVISLCMCTVDDISVHKFTNRFTILTDKEDTLINNPNSLQFAICLVFLPFQSPLVHPALRYEMYRSAYTKSESEMDFGRNWIGVDSKVYLFFLQYIVYSKLNDNPSKARAVFYLQFFTINGEFLGHRTTAFNLLGWIYIQENRMDEAWRCFCQSLQIEPVHNAAKWHVAVMLHTMLRDQ